METITVYSQNYMEWKNTLCKKNAQVVNAKAGGTYIHHINLKGY